MKKLILILTVGIYCLILYLSVIQPDAVGSLRIEISIVIFIGMIALTLYFLIPTELRCAITAHLLVIASIHIPTVASNLEEAKVLPYGYPFTFITQDHTEYVKLYMSNGNKFPYTENFIAPHDNGRDFTHIQIDNWAMFYSWLVIFLLLVTGRLILKKIYGLYRYRS